MASCAPIGNRRKLAHYPQGALLYQDRAEAGEYALGEPVKIAPADPRP